MKFDLAGVFKRFADIHWSFIKTVYVWAYILSLVYASIERVLLILQSGAEGNIAGVLAQFLLFVVLVNYSAIIGALVWGSVGVVVLFVPYLIVRGLIK